MLSKLKGLHIRSPAETNDSIEDHMHISAPVNEAIYIKMRGGGQTTTPLTTQSVSKITDPLNFGLQGAETVGVEKQDEIKLKSRWALSF